MFQFTPEKYKKIEKILLRIAIIVFFFLVILCILILIQFFLRVVFGYDFPSRDLKPSGAEISVEKTEQSSIEEIKEIKNVNTEWNNQIKIIDGNIFYRNEDLEEKQITSKNLDSKAVLSPDGKKIAFFRKTPDNLLHGCWHEDSVIHELWLYDLISEKEELLVSGGSIYDSDIEELSRPGDICKYMLAHFVDLQFSLDGKIIYFSHAAWATSGAIQSVDISTGEIKFVSDGNGGFEVIKDGEYKGNLLIAQKHKYFYGGGTYDICFLVSPEGKELLAVASKEDFYKGNFFYTSKQDRENFLNYVKDQFSDIEYHESDIKGIKRMVEKDEDEGERIFYYLTYPEVEKGEIFSFGAGLGSFFHDLIRSRQEYIIKNSLFDGSLISNNYEITLLKDPLLSIRFDFYENSAGTVHGTYRTEVFNLKGSPNDSRGEFIELKDIFKSDTDYLAVLSEISQNKIAEKFRENESWNYYDDDWVKEGTSPESGNLDKFNLSEDALIITFDPYEVACYAAGKQVVEIPYEELEEYLNYDGIIKDLIKK